MVVSAGSVVTRAYDVTGGEPFRATLVWTDYPADLNAAVARVNELKLEVIDPSGNVWFQTLDGNGLPAATLNPGNLHDAVDNVVEADVVASAIRSLMASQQEWAGTATELLGALAVIVDVRITNSKAWPTSPRALGGRVRRAATFLRKIGISTSPGATW